MEVEFAAPVGTRMIIELDGGLRLLVTDDRAVETAARFINFLKLLPTNQREAGNRYTIRKTGISVSRSG